MKVAGLENMTLSTLIAQVREGGRFVVYYWCIGVGGKTVWYASTARFVRPNQTRLFSGLVRTVLAALTGWWALAGGPVNTLACIRESLGGGRDVTVQLLRQISILESQEPVEFRNPIGSHSVGRTSDTKSHALHAA